MRSRPARSFRAGCCARSPTARSPAAGRPAITSAAPAMITKGSGPEKARNPSRSWNPGPAATITLHEAADEHSEGAWIAEAIDRLLGGSSFHSLDSGRADGNGHAGISLADIAILYRTDAQAAPLGRALTRAGLPFQKRSHELPERRTGVPEIVHEMRLLAADAVD